MKFAATRPNFEPAYQFIKDGCPEKVQKFWESLAKESRLDAEGR